MTRTPTALVNPELLMWARKSAGLDCATVAGKLSIAEERVRAWESGEARPTFAQLRRLAQVCKRPTAVFFLPEKPVDFSPLRDFRRLPSEIPPTFSSELRFLIRRTRERQEWLVESRQDTGFKSLDIVGCLSPTSDVVAAARRARDLLGINLDARSSWPTPDDALREWVEGCEAVGIVVFQSSGVEVAEMRGFALPHAIAPVIVVNSKDTRAARVFTLLHEFAHILLSAEGVSNLDIPDEDRPAERTIELFSNQFAAEVLVPRSHFQEHLRGDVLQEDLDSEIQARAQDYKVSREVIARQLLALGFIDRQTYSDKRDQYRQEALRFRRRRNREREFRVPRARLVVRDNGREFTRAVLGAYGERLITAADLSNLLGTRLRHLTGIEAEALPFRSSRAAR